MSLSYPSLRCSECALQLVETLCLRLLRALVAPPAPRTLLDVDARLSDLCPVDQVAGNALVPSPRLPRERLHRLLLRERALPARTPGAVTQRLAARLERLASVALQLAASFAVRAGRESGPLSDDDVRTALHAGPAPLLALLADETATAPPDPPALSHGELARALVADERRHLRALQLIVLVFRAGLLPWLSPPEVEAVFGNVCELLELAVTLLSGLEDAAEVARDAPGAAPALGACFEGEC